MEEMHSTTPLACASISRVASMICSVENRLTSSRRRHSASSACHPGAERPLPTLHTSTSSFSCRSLTAAATARAPATVVTSPAATPHAAPKERAARSSRSASRPFRNTLQPSPARARAIARPMPDDEPVTSAVFPSRCKFTAYPVAHHIAVLCQRARMRFVRRARGLEDEIARIARPRQLGEYRVEIGVAFAERHRGAASDPVLHVDVGDAGAAGADLLARVVAERGAIADVVVDAEHVPGIAGDECGKRPRREIALEQHHNAQLAKQRLDRSKPLVQRFGLRGLLAAPCGKELA